MPDLTYVVPVYNKQSYIAETLEGLKRQKHKNIEVIIIDDCSTDNSLEIINHYLKDKRFSCIVLPENKGRSFARNKGNTYARSPIIAVNDADDISHPERTDEILKTFKDKKIDVFYSSFLVSDESGKIHKIMPAVQFNEKRLKRDGCTYIGHSTMAYTKESVCNTKYSDGEWSRLGMDDWKIQVDFFKGKYKFGYSDDPLVIYRDCPNSIVLTRNHYEVVKLKREYLKTI